MGRINYERASRREAAGLAAHDEALEGQSLAVAGAQPATGKQLAYLRNLARALDTKVPGRMSRTQASDLIRRWERRRESRD